MQLQIAWECCVKFVGNTNLYYNSVFDQIIGNN